MTISHLRAILWAQMRTLRNYPRMGAAWSTIIGVIWYGGWLAATIAVVRVMSDPDEIRSVAAALPGALSLVFLYWQVMPLLLAATGASLDIRKLQAYPIPVLELFAVEAMLRVTAGLEMFMLLLGGATAVALNPALSKTGVAGFILYLAFNLFLAVGLREGMRRILAHQRIREIAFFVLVLSAALPQLLIARGGGRVAGMLHLLRNDFWSGWPWTAAANLALGRHALPAFAILAAWCALAALFGLWQFSASLNFDVEAAAARPARSAGRAGLLERLYHLPSLVFSDPLAALIEKEIRTLVRSPRFRLVFLMGFTFGVIILLPTTLTRNGYSLPFFRNNYLMIVSMYSLLLLGEVCFWNAFGFDRSAAQMYYLAPIPLARVLLGKNLTAVVFIILEVAAVTMACGLIGMPLSPHGLLEAFAVASVVTIYLMSAGNLTSVRQPRGVNPDSALRHSTAGRVQAVLLVIYPLAYIPAGLAYLARYAFNNEAALFAVLAFFALVGVVIYRIALDSAVQLAERQRERILAALSAGEGPIAA